MGRGLRRAAGVEGRGERHGATRRGDSRAALAFRLVHHYDRVCSRLGEESRARLGARSTSPPALGPICEALSFFHRGDPSFLLAPSTQSVD